METHIEFHNGKYWDYFSHTKPDGTRCTIYFDSIEAAKWLIDLQLAYQAPEYPKSEELFCIVTDKLLSRRGELAMVGFAILQGRQFKYRDNTFTKVGKDFGQYFYGVNQKTYELHKFYNSGVYAVI